MDRKLFIIYNTLAYFTTKSFTTLPPSKWLKLLFKWAPISLLFNNALAYFAKVFKGTDTLNWPKLLSK